MRAVKSVLVMAGIVKRNNPKMEEPIVLIRAMRDSNIPKFIKEDLPLFNAIVRDLFPGVILPDANYELLVVLLLMTWLLVTIVISTLQINTSDCD